MISKHITSLGVEIEGGWEGSRWADEIKEDCSVKNLACDYVGEIALRPYKTLSSLYLNLEDRWPTDWNETCGMHIHMMLEPIGWMVLASEEGYRAYLKQLKDFARQQSADGSEGFREALRRLAGTNEYCSDMLMIERGLMGQDTTGRYWILNSQSYYNHKTLEMRAWPQAEVSEGLAMIRETVEAVEAVIETYGDMDFLGNLATEEMPGPAMYAELPSYRVAKKAKTRPLGVPEPLFPTLPQPFNPEIEATESDLDEWATAP